MIKKILGVILFSIGVIPILMGTNNQKNHGFGEKISGQKEYLTDIVVATETPKLLHTPKKKKKKPCYVEIVNGKITKPSAKSICRHIGGHYDIDPDLLLAIIEIESDFVVDALGVSGDKGLCQIVERFHKERMKKLDISDIYDPYNNVTLCADILSELKGGTYGDDIYYYAKKVIKKYNKLKGDDWYGK